MRLWQIAAALLAGIAVGAAAPGRLAGAFGHATLYVFLPALIFEAAWNLDCDAMLRAWRAIALLAVPGVVLTAAIVALAAHAGGLATGSAVLLGAVLSATDPIAVVAIFKRLAVPRALATIVESESLLNDAIAVVLYRAALAAIATGFTPAAGVQIAGTALLGSLAGIALGMLAGALAAYAVRRVPAPAVQTLTTVLAAYGAYFAAERLGFSGIFAAIACGITLRRMERMQLPAASARVVRRVWRRASSAANALLFFLIGAAIDVRELLRSPLLIALTLAGVLVARTALAYGLLAFARPALHVTWKTVVRLAGVRGALSLALALATPAFVAQRGALIDATFAVVVATVLVSALTLDRRVRRLRLPES